MTSERERLLTRVSKLLNMAAGATALGSIEEGATFAAKAQEMLLRHGLSMTEIEAFNQHDSDPMNEETVDPESYKGKRYAKPLRWQVILSEAIAHAYGGVAFYWDRSNRITFVGRDSTRPVMVYVYSLLARTGPRLMMKARREARAEGEGRTGFEGSYMIGFARAIRERLLKERQELEARIHREAHDPSRVSTALVRIRNEPDEARRWYQQKHFPPRPEPSAEEKARWEAARKAREDAERAARELETPEERAKRERREERERERFERRWAKEQERRARQSEFAERDQSLNVAIERGYQDGRTVQITKGLTEGQPLKRKGLLDA